MIIYENHENGNLYATDEEIRYEDLYCEPCGDSDRLIGFADNVKELKELLEDDHSKEYIDEFINKLFQEM